MFCSSRPRVHDMKCHSTLTPTTRFFESQFLPFIFWRLFNGSIEKKVYNASTECYNAVFYALVILATPVRLHCHGLREPCYYSVSRAASSVGVMYRISGPNTGTNPGGGRILKQKKLN